MAKSQKKSKKKRAQRNTKNKLKSKSQSSKTEFPKTTYAFLKTIGKRTWSAIAVLGVLIGFLGITAALPRVSLSSNAPLDPSDPFSVPFTISNDGYLPLLDFKFTCTVANAQWQPRNRMWNNKAVGYDLSIPRLEPNEKTTRFCSPGVEFVNDKFQGADIDLDVSFWAYWIFPHQKKTIRFTTIINKDGQLMWINRASSEPRNK